MIFFLCLNHIIVFYYIIGKIGKGFTLNALETVDWLLVATMNLNDPTIEYFLITLTHYQSGLPHNSL